MRTVFTGGRVFDGTGVAPATAELMGLGDELGTLSPGKRADVVVVDGDPYDFATLADRIDGVWKDGVRVVPFA